MGAWGVSALRPGIPERWAGARAGEAWWATLITLDFILCHDRVIDPLTRPKSKPNPTCKLYPVSQSVSLHLLKYPVHIYCTPVVHTVSPALTASHIPSLDFLWDTRPPQSEVFRGPGARPGAAYAKSYLILTLSPFC